MQAKSETIQNLNKYIIKFKIKYNMKNENNIEH